MKSYILDCTLRDGGYYNCWDFPNELISHYFTAMVEAKVDFVEVGLRSLINTSGFKGACAYSTDNYLNSLNIPKELNIGVMINASELVNLESQEDNLQKLFPHDAVMCRVKLVRIACHVHEFKKVLPVSQWLKNKGFMVGFNLMQIADRTKEEIIALANEAQKYPLDVLYFADSMGSMNPIQTAQIIQWIQSGWKGALGIHTHDNMSMALQNTMTAYSNGVSWLDATVTGMGRGPGNARLEELLIAMDEHRLLSPNLIPLMELLRKYFKPMQQHYGWGTNPYYFLSGKYGIHPTYIQEMLNDPRYNEEDIFAVINYLKFKGGKNFNASILGEARHFYPEHVQGTWDPKTLIKNKNVLLLGTGPGASQHRDAIETYIQKHNPLVIALNTQTAISADLIDVRIACHPVRLLADCEKHTQLPQPLITPASMLPKEVRNALTNKILYDYGLTVMKDTFKFNEHYGVLPTSLVIAYALAVLASGQANRILMAGFDGYGLGDQRNLEMNNIIKCYQSTSASVPLVAITPTSYNLDIKSIYGMEI